LGITMPICSSLAETSATVKGLLLSTMKLCMAIHPLKVSLKILNE